MDICCCDLIVTILKQDGWTALHIAACNGYVEVVKWLLASGANVNEKYTVSCYHTHITMFF